MLERWEVMTAAFAVTALALAIVRWISVGAVDYPLRRLDRFTVRKDDDPGAFWASIGAFAVGGTLMTAWFLASRMYFSGH